MPTSLMVFLLFVNLSPYYITLYSIKSIESINLQLDRHLNLALKLIDICFLQHHHYYLSMMLLSVKL
ncbi:MAG: hypothetical protein CMK81_06070 [Pseudomonadales bacterium]|nr:hypothetical protein [Pseudomonadales bacterium]